MRNIYIYINYNNIVVLKHYLDIIKTSYEKHNGIHCEYIESMDRVKQDDIVLFPMAIDAFKYYIKGYKNIILWQQGATGDESYMRHHSVIRRMILNKIDTYIMRKSINVFFVSEYMKKYYETIGKRSLDDKCIIMPCFNEDFDDSIYIKKNYTKKVFGYVGSIDLWQCFETTVQIYKKIEDIYPDAFFKVLTFDVEGATCILTKYGVKNYSVKCVKKELVLNELIEVNYGFILREDYIVNRVATPTKISSYLAAGVIPIFSDCLKDFNVVSRSMKFAVAIGKENNIEPIINLLNKPILQEEIKKEYKTIFENYYGKENYIKKIVEKSRGLSNGKETFS